MAASPMTTSGVCAVNVSRAGRCVIAAFLGVLGGANRAGFHVRFVAGGTDGRIDHPIPCSGEGGRPTPMELNLLLLT